MRWTSRGVLRSVGSLFSIVAGPLVPRFVRVITCTRRACETRPEVNSKTAAIAALFAAAGSVHAAGAPVTRSEPVVVTATRFEERGTDRPVNLTVITSEDIRASPAKTVPDLLAEQAGIAAHDLF